MRGLGNGVQMREIQVMMADDHSMVREGIKALLEFDGDIKIIAQANDGVECLSKLEQVKPDVLLLDINMPRLDGLSVLETIKRSRPNMKVIILTIHNEAEYLLNAYEKGVDGYVLKDSDSEILKRVIRIVYKGEQYIEPALMPRLRERLDDKRNPIEKEERLSKREFEILKLVALGMYNKEIADRLSISEKTVKNHMSSIFRKIKVSDRTQAAVYAIRNNYVKLD